jgi:excisionase family DNA binding protein
MTAFSLQEAADQTGTSRADIWRAIQAGSLPAERLPGGGYAIDPVELFRVFERPALLFQSSPGGATLEKTAEAPNASLKPAAPPSDERAAASEPAAADESAVAFAALGVALKGLMAERQG